MQEGRSPLLPSVAQGAAPPLRGAGAPRTTFALVLGSYVCVLVGFATLVNTASPLHHDMTEAWAWGKQFQLGYAKHPPFTAWIVGLWFLVMPRTSWSFYLLSGINVAVALAGVWMLAGNLLSAPGRLAAILFLMLTPSFSLWALKFNVNAPLISTWPWTTFFFLRSLETRRIDYSIYAGLLGGMALLTKYYSLALFATLLLVAILHPERRRYFTSLAPHLTNAAGLLVITPHVWWTIAAGFPTIDYAISKTQYAVAEARSSALGSVAGALAALGVGLVAYAIAFARRFPALLQTALAAALDWRSAWLGCLAYGPLLLTIAAYLFVNAKITIGFLLPAFFALPVVFLALSRADVTPMVLRRLAWCVGGIWMAMLAAAPAIACYVFAFGDRVMLEPRHELAEEVTRYWHATFGRPLRYVSGQQALATAVTFYSPDAPSYFIFDHPEHSPWVSSLEAKREGVLILCRGDGRAAQKCSKEGAAYAGARAVRLTMDLAANFLGRAAQSQRFVLIVLPPE